MATQSREFVGIAERIKDHEISTKVKIEHCRGTLNRLSLEKKALISRLAVLEASLAAEYDRTDQNGSSDYGRIALIEAEISATRREMFNVDREIGTAQTELWIAENELRRVQEKKAATLFEIQERARKTSKNIAATGSMCGAYAAVGKSLQSTMSTSLTSLSAAASILGGSTGVSSGAATGGAVGTSRSGGGYSGASSGALSAFSVSANTNTGGTGAPISPLAFQSRQTWAVTPASAGSFNSQQKGSEPTTLSKFTSKQTSNQNAAKAFSESDNSDSLNIAENYTSSQQTMGLEDRMESADKSGSSEILWHNLMPKEQKLELAGRNKKNLIWTGDVGNSKCVAVKSNSKLAKALAKAGVDGIEYHNGDADFTPVSPFTLNFDDTDELYCKLVNSISMKNLFSREDFNGMVRRKWQSMAKKTIVDRIVNDPSFAEEFMAKTGVNVNLVGKRGKFTMTILSYELSRVGLTMHETPDGKSIQFVPTVIHNAFKHTGGIAEMLERMLSADIRESLLRLGKLQSGASKIFSRENMLRLHKNKDEENSDEKHK